MPLPGKPAAFLLGLLMVVSSLPVSLSSENGAPNRAFGRDLYIPAAALEKSVEVQKEGRYFFSVGPDNQIREMPVPAVDAGMPPDMVRALDRAPDWLRADLAKKFRELATTGIITTRPAIGDFDQDGAPDLFCPSGGGIVYYPNIGNPLFPEFITSSNYDMGLNLRDPVPAAGDITGDVRPELAIGTSDGSVYIAQFAGSTFDPGSYDFSYDASRCPKVTSRAAPAFGDLNHDDLLDMVVGDGAGKVQFFGNVGNRTHWNFQKTPLSLAFAAIAVLGPAVPALADLNGDGKLDLAVGGRDGLVHYFQNIGTTTVPAWAPDDLLMFGGIQAAGGAAPCLADQNGDNRTDLLVGEGTQAVLLYENAGSSSAPAWETWPFYDAVSQAGYYPANEYLTCLNFSAGIAFAGALNTIDEQCVDELAFSIAHSAVEVLRRTPVGLFEENARLIYENDRYLDYVQVVDYANYSTTRYTVNESGALRSCELPRDIYYWYIVMPKITDEVPLYIDPSATSGSPNESAPPPAGQFWRGWLFNHADASYPPDPPNATARYPKTMVPPLLKDVLAGVTTLWNCSRYGSPAGFDSDGINNSHPFDYGDHAVERVSNWVMKTLPLNEQESGDGERPVQPVRIAAGHNGNCGELQDLTVAAARACLIPAAGASMLDEDHVWIEFYDRGWHQWDNYWSDSGAVIDDFMNYWLGWGHRGGSGITLWRGDDYEFEVTGQYIPPVSQSHVTVNVKDSNGRPVDGARVRMMSYWMAEHELPKPAGVTLPITLPSLAPYNFTDCKGTATFVVADNNFTIDVVSKLGHMVVNKTYIGESENRVLNFTLPGRLPGSPLPVRPAGTSEGRQIEYQVKVLGAEQRPPNPQVLTTSVQPIYNWPPLDIYMMNSDNFTTYLSGRQAEGDSLASFSDFPGSTGLSSNGTWYFVISNENTLETSNTVHVLLRLFVRHDVPGVAIDYPTDGAPIDGSAPIPVSGRVLGDPSIWSLELSIDGGAPMNITSALDRLTGRWRHDVDLTALSSGPHRLGARLTDSLGFANSTSVNILLDKLPPQVFIDSPPFGAIFGLNDVLEFRGRATDDTQVTELAYSVDGMPAVDLTSAFSGGGWNFTHPAGTLGGGRHMMVVSARDGAGRAGNATTEFELRDEAPPVLRITAPAEDAAIDIGGAVLLQGSAHDDSRIASLSLSIGQTIADILPSLGPDGDWSYSWNTAGRSDTGDVSFTITARDDSGNRAFASRVIRLVDRQAPSVAILRPANGTVFRIGDVVTVNGTAGDNLGIVRLEARLGTAGWKNILGAMKGGRFSHDFDTADLAEGRYNITVMAFDSSGNGGTATCYVSLEKAEQAAPAKKKSTSLLPGMELESLLAAIGGLAVALRHRRRKDD